MLKNQFTEINHSPVSRFHVHANFPAQRPSIALYPNLAVHEEKQIHEGEKEPKCHKCRLDRAKKAEDRKEEKKKKKKIKAHTHTEVAGARAKKIGRKKRRSGFCAVKTRSRVQRAPGTSVFSLRSARARVPNVRPDRPGKREFEARHTHRLLSARRRNRIELWPIAFLI